MSDKGTFTLTPRLHIAGDGCDEAIVPSAYQQNGQIRDYDHFMALVGSFGEGAYCTFVMDCCHSGFVLDLPFQFATDGQSKSMPVLTDLITGSIFS